jgi:hypothetical protein
MTEAKEIWRPVVGFEDRYEVSNLGRIHILKADRYTLGSLGCNGYYSITLYAKDKHRTAKVHKIVAEAFVPNPGNLPFINHKDENPANNAADNLEWCTQQYNGSYGDKAKRVSMNSGRNRPVAVYDLDGNLLQTYRNMQEAAKGIGATGLTVLRCCRGKQKTLYGTMVLRYNDKVEKWEKGLPMEKAKEVWPPEPISSSAERTRKTNRKLFARGYFTAINDFYEKIKQVKGIPDELQKVIDESFGELLD